MTSTYFGFSDTGSVRTNNEDAFVLRTLWDDDHILSVVIDGVGGYEGGEVAADITAKTITDYLLGHTQGKPIELLKMAVVEANNAIVAAKQRRPELSLMGCVCTATIIDLRQRQLAVVHIGDTRLYRIAEGKMAKLTHDHSLVGYREEIGELTEEEAMAHPNRNVIERYLGETYHEADDPHFIDAAIFPIAGGETLLYCSDGLYDMLTSERIRALLSAGEASSAKAPDAEALPTSASVEDVVHSLVDAANAEGGLDNVTVIVARLEDNDAPAIPEVNTAVTTTAAAPEPTASAGSSTATVAEASASAPSSTASAPEPTAAAPSSTATVVEALASAPHSSSPSSDNTTANPTNPTGASTDSATSSYSSVPGLPSKGPRVWWWICWPALILAGILAGYAVGRCDHSATARAYADSVRVYADSVQTLNSLVDSLRQPTPGDSVDAANPDSILMPRDTTAKETLTPSNHAHTE